MLLDCQDITYQYPNTELPLFKHLSFGIDMPGFHAIFGPSGVGKTSLARILTGQINDFTGTVTTKKDNSKILYTYNLERLPDWSSVENHLAKVTPSGKEDLKEVFIDFFGVRKIAHYRFSKLSLGQKNRVNLIRYLVQAFDVLIMDECLANVDERRREAIILKIKEHFPDRCFLYISHNVSEVARFCRQITILRSVHKSPQAIAISGLNQTKEKPFEKETLEKTMLEVMNAV